VLASYSLAQCLSNQDLGRKARKKFESKEEELFEAICHMSMSTNGPYSIFLL